MRPILVSLSDVVLLPPVAETEDERMVYPSPELEVIALDMVVVAVLALLLFPAPIIKETITDPPVMLFICIVFYQGSEGALLN